MKIKVNNLLANKFYHVNLKRMCLQIESSLSVTCFCLILESNLAPGINRDLASKMNSSAVVLSFAHNALTKRFNLSEAFSAYDLHIFFTCKVILC